MVHKQTDRQTNRQWTNFNKFFFNQNDEPICQISKLITKTYGTLSAPYLAIQTIQQLLENEKRYHHEYSMLSNQSILLRLSIFDGEAKIPLIVNEDVCDACLYA